MSMWSASLCVCVCVLFNASPRFEEWSIVCATKIINLSDDNFWEITSNLARWRNKQTSCCFNNYRKQIVDSRKKRKCQIQWVFVQIYHVFSVYSALARSMCTQTIFKSNPRSLDSKRGMSGQVLRKHKLRSQFHYWQ